MSIDEDMLLSYLDVYLPLIKLEKSPIRRMGLEKEGLNGVVAFTVIG